MAKIGTLHSYVIKHVKTSTKGHCEHCYSLHIKCGLKDRHMKLGKIVTLKVVRITYDVHKSRKTVTITKLSNYLFCKQYLILNQHGSNRKPSVLIN